MDSFVDGNDWHKTGWFARLFRLPDPELKSRFCFNLLLLWLHFLVFGYLGFSRVYMYKILMSIDKFTTRYIFKLVELSFWCLCDGCWNNHL
jgi:hypothetical protein